MRKSARRVIAAATAPVLQGTTTTFCRVSYLSGQGGKNKYVVDIGGNFLCVMDSGACRCIRRWRLDLAVLRNLDHLSDRATRKWPRTRNIHSPAEDVSRSSLNRKQPETKLRLFCFSHPVQRNSRPNYRSDIGI